MNRFLWLLLIVPLAGCASLWDAPKRFLGFSTRKLEAARPDAPYRDFRAARSHVFAEVLAVAGTEGYTVFLQDDVRGMIVLMGIPGMVDTTEVGVFVASLGQGTVRVELTSRSSPARQAVAEALFPALLRKFSETAP